MSCDLAKEIDKIKKDTEKISDVRTEVERIMKGLKP